MATREEVDICKAPQGTFRIVHVDPRDHWPTPEGEPLESLDDVKRKLNGMLYAQREVMQVYNDKGERVSL